MAETPDIEETAKSNRGVAMLIAMLALLLAISDMFGGNADNEAIEHNVRSANLWSFYQAKTIRRTTVTTAAEDMDVRLLGVTDPAIKAAMEKRIADWRATAARYESEPETGEGRKELAARAKQAEEDRMEEKARGDIYDFASALLQIAIVLASAAIITGVGALAWAAGGLGAIGATLMVIAWKVPNLIGTIF